MERRYSTRDIRGLPHELYQLCYKHIEERLGNTDVFDYLMWLREHRNIEPELIVKFLNVEANALIKAGGVPDWHTLVYREPVGAHKQDLADTIALKLGPLESVERSSSDRNAITLIKIKKPRLDQIVDIQDCLDDYSRVRAERPNNIYEHDTQLRWGQTFHVFPQELEAWYIERSYAMQNKSNRVPMLPPRIVRLLEDPDLMQIFVHGIATGAVEKTENQDWIWHGPSRDVVLVSSEDDPYADVIKAAIIFVLRKGEGRRDSLMPIPREAARESVLVSAQAKSATVEQMLFTFAKDRMDNFLNDHAPKELVRPLRMVFTFYCDPKTRTGLQFRVDLP
jgi:hypothetical protein